MILTFATAEQEVAVQILQTLDWVVGLWMLLKIASLFSFGAIVAFLQTTETQVWKCFVIGIAAPALITTYVNGANAVNYKKAASQTVPSVTIPATTDRPKSGGIFDLIFTSAFAQDAASKNSSNSQKDALAAIRKVTISNFGETSTDKFVRGFLGYDAPRYFVNINTISDEARAKSMAAAIYRFSECALNDPKVKPRSVIADFAFMPPPIVLVAANNRGYSVMTQFSNVDAAAAYQNLFSRLKDDLTLDLVATTASRARRAIQSNILDDIGILADPEPEQKLLERIVAAAYRECVTFPP